MQIQSEKGTAILVIGRCNIKDYHSVLKKLSSFKTPQNGFYQAFLADSVWSLGHIAFALEQTRRGFERKTAFSSDSGREFLIRLSGQKQIQVAFDRLGLKPGVHTIGLIATGGEKKEMIQNIETIAAELKLKKQKTIPKKKGIKATRFLQSFGIHPKAIKALKDYPIEQAIEGLIQEKIALVELEK